MQNPDTAQLGTPAYPPAPEPAPETKTNWRALLIVFCVVFIDLLGFGIILPLLPRYADKYLGALSPGQGSQGAEEGAVLGALMSAFSLMQFVFAPIWGRVSDRVGRRPILILGLAGSVVFYTVFGFASDLPVASAGLALTLLFVSRFGAGIAGATISTAQAVIADSTPPEHRKHGMALIGMAFGLGFTFGPLIGFGSLYWMPEQHGIIGYVAAGLSTIALAGAIWLLPETRHPGGPSAVRRRLLDMMGLVHVLRTSSIGPVVLTFFLATFGFGMFEPTLALLIRDGLGLDPDDSFLIFAYVGFVLMLTQGFLYRRLAKRVTEPTFMLVGILLMGLGMALLGGMTYLAMNSGPMAAKAGELAKGAVPSTSFGTLLAFMMVSIAIAVIGFAFLTPSAQALVSRRTDPARQGEVLGANQAAGSLARILGPFVGLVLYKAQASHMLPYVVGAALVLLMLPLIPRVRRG